MGNERTGPFDDPKPFYEGGYLRIPVDEYYDDEGNLHSVDPEEKSRERPGSEEKLKSKTVTEITIEISVRSEI